MKKRHDWNSFLAGLNTWAAIHSFQQHHMWWVGFSVGIAVWCALDAISNALMASHGKDT